MEYICLRELCRNVGVSRRSIQCYEHEGLMGPSSKNKYGHLLYDAGMIERAKLIHFMQEVGFTLKEIKEIIDAPPSVIREAFELRLPELEKEEEHLKELIYEVKQYINHLNESDGKNSL